jgi:hypothetical protein
MTNQNDYFKTPAQVFEDFQEHKDLQEYANQQHALISDLMNQVEQLKVENAHLKQLLTVAAPSIFSSSQPLTEEELICLEQITRLKTQSEKRELTLDEVKKLDLLHKNLKMIRDNHVIDVKPTKQKSLSNEKLLAIAAKKLEKLEPNE